MNISSAKYFSFPLEAPTGVPAGTGVSAAASPEILKLRRACREFEAIFISFMLKSMRDATPESGLFGEGLGSKVYSDIFDAKLAENMADSGKMRIGDILFDQYAPLIQNTKPMIEKAQPGPEPGAPGAAIPASYVTDPDLLEAEATRGVLSMPQTRNPIRTRLELPETLDIPEPETVRKPEMAFEDTIQVAADKYGLNPNLLKAVIRHESGGDPRAVSPKGAKGLMQLLDSTAKMVGVTDPFNPVQNIMGGAKYLAQLIKRFGGDLEKTIASYNAGPGAVEKYNGIPPFEETKSYVEKVLGTMRVRNE